ncbi:uncharacterized protein LOC114251187 [Bombyx mandarina]|uniref:Uncharacterized protein n=2 Tax=Bombyx TaxID=7090 RepID=A0A8R1WFC8_BOMMO|nr:uncharacterized protein LOC101735826 [Bombyx mori]XP_028041173.1 uncharacterized protein LOC114251187 [Bombyx mandarina]
MNLKQFTTKNAVLLIMIPALGGLHYGWYKLQSVDSLVPDKDRSRLPKWLQELGF